MENQRKLFKVATLEVERAGGVVFEFTFTFHYSTTKRLTSYKKNREYVKIKCFDLLVELSKKGVDSVEFEREEKYFSSLCSRSGEVAYLIGQLTKHSKPTSTADVAEVVKRLRKDFSLSLNKDAYNKLRKQLGITDKMPFSLRSRKERSPLTQIPEFKKGVEQ